MSDKSALRYEWADGQVVTLPVKVLGEAVLILETLHWCVTWELAPEIKTAIAEALPPLREALGLKLSPALPSSDETANNGHSLT